MQISHHSLTTLLANFGRKFGGRRLDMHSTFGTECTAGALVVEAKDAGILNLRTGAGTSLRFQLAATGTAPKRFKLPRLAEENDAAELGLRRTPCNTTGADIAPAARPCAPQAMAGYKIEQPNDALSLAKTNEQTNARERNATAKTQDQRDETK